MASLPTPDPNYIPPNNPFSSPQSYLLDGVTNPYVLGAGLTVSEGGTISATGGGGGGGTVTSILTGAGLTGGPITATGTIALDNSGVVAGTYAYATVTVDAYGRVTFATASTTPVAKSLYYAKGTVLGASAPEVPAALGPGNDNEVLIADSSAPAGIRWGPAAAAGVLEVVGVAPIVVTGPTEIPQVEVLDATTFSKGVVRVGTNIDNSGGTISVADASTSGKGVIQLFDGTNSASTSLALTAAQGQVLQSQINAISAATNLTLAGTMDGSTGLMLTVTGDGPAAGFSVGSPLPAPSLANTDYFVIVTTPGDMTPPWGTLTSTTQGDWWLSDGTAWQFLNVGLDLPAASTTSAGIVRLEDSTLSTSTTEAATANSVKVVFDLANTRIPYNAYTARGDLLVATAASTPTALPVGVTGQVLTVDITCPSRVRWSNPPAPALPNQLGLVFGCTLDLTKENVALGQFAICNVTTGCKNVAVGQCALLSVSNGSSSTAVGYKALRDNVAGLENTAVGVCSAACATLGENTALGAYSLGSGSTVQKNTSVGYQSLFSTTGLGNTALGWRAGMCVLGGGRNVSIGYCAQVSDPALSCQLSIGFDLGQNWLTGTSTKAIRPGAGIIDCAGSCGTAGQVLTSTGSNALQWATGAPNATPLINGILFGCTTTTSTTPVALGWCSGGSITTGSFNTSVGYWALKSASSGGNNTAVGFCSLSNGNGNFNTSIGSCAGRCSNFASGNTFTGAFAGTGVIDGCFNVGVGFCALSTVTNGCCNVALGWLALTNTTACQNVAVGTCALAGNTSASLNTAVGHHALQTGNGFANTALGGCAARLTTGNYNTAVGQQALEQNTTGTRNVAVGLNALNRVTSTGNNTAVGFNALFGGGASGNTGANNTAVGTCAFQCMTTGNNNTMVGFCAGHFNSSGTNNIVIGANAASSSSSVSNEVTIGSVSNTSYRVYANWTNISDGRDKSDVEDLPLGLEFLVTLRPVKFKWDFRKGGENRKGSPEIGFIAQEVLEAQQNANASYAELVSESDPEQLMLAQTKLIPVLVQALKELNQKFEDYVLSHP